MHSHYCFLHFSVYNEKSITKCNQPISECKMESARSNKRSTGSKYMDPTRLGPNRSFWQFENNQKPQSPIYITLSSYCVVLLPVALCLFLFNHHCFTMSSKFDPSQVVDVLFLVTGDEVGLASSLVVQRWQQRQLAVRQWSGRA